MRKTPVSPKQKYAKINSIELYTIPNIVRNEHEIKMCSHVLEANMEIQNRRKINTWQSRHVNIPT